MPPATAYCFAAFCLLVCDAPGAIPTRGLPRRRRTLYAAELREHEKQMSEYRSQQSEENKRRKFVFIGMFLTVSLFANSFNLASELGLQTAALIIAAEFNLITIN